MSLALAQAETGRQQKREEKRRKKSGANGWLGSSGRFCFADGDDALDRLGKT